jgi:hypothetical protein
MAKAKKTAKVYGKKSLPKNLDPKIKGIQGEGMYDPYWILEKFKPNPRNYKKHDKEQKKALYESVSQHGWVVPMVVNLKTNLFVDGHGRVEMAAEYGIGAKVGFIYADEKEEASIIATFDSLSLMSETDPDAHQQLLKTAYEYAKENNMSAMKQLTLHLTERADRIKEGTERAKTLIKARKTQIEERQKELDEDHDFDDFEDLETEELTDKVYKNDVNFSSDNIFEVPDLLPDMLYGSDPDELEFLPEKAWNPAEGELEEDDIVCYSIRSAIEYDENDEDPHGFLCFYTEDERFEHVFSDASNRLPSIHAQKYKAVFEPDFSYYSEWPFCRKLWSLFKNRWVSRYLQEMGTKVIPQIMKYYGGQSTKKLNKYDTEQFISRPHLLSLPPGEVKVATMNARMQHKIGGGPEAVDSIKEGVVQGLISAYEFLGTECVIMYGGLDIEKYIHSELPKGLKILYLDSYINRRRKWNKEKKRERKAKTDRKRSGNAV